MTAHNLPHQTTTFVGRSSELTEIAALLSDPACRLLTLLGAGGIGKTRLALQVAADQLPHFSHGVFFVSLAPVNSPDQIASAIANALQISLISPEDSRVQIVHFLREKQLLLLMDNFEHLLAGVDFLLDILQSAPNVKLLVTSRERLNLQEEWVFAVDGLRTPAAKTAEPLESYSAVQLFVQRARQVQPNFSLNNNAEAVKTICQHVEGMPLGLELAASWLRAMSCSQIAVQIARSIDFLTTPHRNVPERHRSLRAVFVHSWSMLSPGEQQVMARLSIFRGGFDREAAEQVAGATLTLLASLVDKSLIRLNTNGRYDLHELLRQYAEELLTAAGETSSTRGAYCVYYAQLLERLTSTLKGPDQVSALDKIQTELDNVLTSWNWAVLFDKEVEIGQSLDGLARFCQMRTRHREALEAFEMAVNRFGPLENELAGQVFMWLGWFHQYWDREKEFRCVQKGVTLLPQVDAYATVVMSLRQLLYFVDKFGGYETLQNTYRHHLAAAKARVDEWGTAWVLHCMGELALLSKKFPEAQSYLQESLSRFRALGDRWGASWPTNQLGRVAQGLKNYQEAFHFHQEHLALCQEIGDLGGIRFALGELGLVAYVLGEGAISRQFFYEALEVSRAGNTPWYRKGSIDIYSAACLLITEGQIEQAVELLAVLHRWDAMPSTRDKWARWLDTLQTQLAPEVFAAAVQRGEASDLEIVAVSLVERFHIPEVQQAGSIPFAGGNSLLKHHLLSENLTQRELQVLQLISEGLSNAEIAQKLFLSVGTVKVHTSNIYSKLGVNSRTQAVAEAQKLSLL